MLDVVVVLMLILWLAAVMSANSFGGFVHVLLVLAIGSFLVGLFRNRRS